MPDERIGAKVGGPPAGHDEWHAGERKMQTLAGSANVLEKAAARILRASLSEQMRAFFPRLPFLAIGFIDADGNPWGTLLPGPPGFVWSPEPTLLRVDRAPPEGDPLAPSLRPGLPVGLLGIELSTRRRNRVNGVVFESNSSGFTVRVEQCFGNCPQYIQQRALAEASPPPAAIAAQPIVGLNPEARRVLASCDTLFVVTFTQGPNDVSAVDMSHRGGRSGFVHVNEDGMLAIPDFPGNRYFNTLGNIVTTGRAGLVVPIFDTGDLLLLTGDANVGLTAKDQREAAQVAGAKRLWRLVPLRGRWLRRALPLGFRFQDWSPQALATGTWPSE